MNSDRNKNRTLTSARKNKNDEFYTCLRDIENELKHYKPHFKDKVVYCNCDDPRVSNFFEYFAENFEVLGLKKLIASCYKNDNIDLFSNHDKEKAVYLVYEGDKNKNKIVDDEEIEVLPIKGDGDFRSDECIAILKEADIICTNPPFSLFREYVTHLMKYKKDFLIIGNQNAITYKDIFPLIQGNKLWLGVNNGAKEYVISEEFAKEFPNKVHRTDDGKSYTKMGNTCWFTNLDIKKRHKKLESYLYKEYNDADYPKYDNYDAINVNKTKEIPVNYGGAMGVPISFLDKYNPDEFEIVNANDIRVNDRVPQKPHGLIKDTDGTINGKPTYVRIVIKRR